MSAPGSRGSLRYVALALTIFLSAFLLFQVQPLMTKFILPWFGGSPAVWTTAMLFFQFVLFLGYCYAHALQRWLGHRPAAVLHIALLVIAALCLPIIPSTSWKPTDVFEPTRHILALLLLTVGVPYFLLSSTGPLVQAWFGKLAPGSSPYRLYSLSNIGSLLALLSYPTLIEPYLSVRTQAHLWSAGFLVFAAMCALAAWWTRGLDDRPETVTEADATPPRWWHRILWLGLPAMASLMLLATTNQVCQDVAPMPFLWVAPLALYLLTFIICFDHPRWYRPVPTAVITAALLFLTARIGDFDLPPAAEITVYFAALFGVCMLCHGEVVRLRPHLGHLTEFYLLLSAGGALGGLLVSLVAPRVFRTFMEFPLGLLLSFVLCVAILLQRLARSPQSAPATWLASNRRLAGTALALVAVLLGGYMYAGLSDKRKPLYSGRNFYGTVTVLDVVQPGIAGKQPDQPYRVFLSGHISHGRQYLAEDLRRAPIGYFGHGTGIAEAIGHVQRNGPVRIGVVGMGVATLATYARAGDEFRFYEINPQVEEVARQHFTYLSDCVGRCEVILGDARLVMEREAPQQYDLIALDAFTADAPPVHLLTVQAFETYLRHLKPGGVLVVNSTNTYLDLAPVVQSVGRTVGLLATRRATDADDARLQYRTDYVLLSHDPKFIQAYPPRPPTDRPVHERGPVWTDDFSNIFQVMLER